MKERVWGCMAALLLTLAMSVSLLAGCAGRTAEDEEEPIQVYLWTANLYEKYAPYVQAQLPDVDVEFVVGNNDLNFYKFLNENGELPEDEQGQPDAPTRPDEQMQPNAPELENAGETVYDEIDESLLAPGYENWTDLNRFMQTVLENPELSVEQRVQYIQQAYERTKDKTDILVPRSAADIKEILENGKFEFDWPDELGFNPGYTAIGEGTALPAQMDRYGHAGGNNFCSIPEAGAYTFLQRSLPYLENSAAYHAWSFNGDTYLAKIEAVRQQDWNGLNGLLASEGLAPVGEAECIRLTKAYENYLRTVQEKIGADFSAPYGVTGTVAAAFGSDGGADQWTMPLSAQQMEDLGILYTK